MLGRLWADSEAEVRQTDPWGAWPGDAVPTWAGMNVSAETSIQLLTVYGCVRLISDSISTLPVDCFRETGDLREAIPAPDWIKKPTVDLVFTEWCSQVLSSLLLHGNAYISVLRVGNRIIELVVLDPNVVRVERRKGRKVYIVNGLVFTGELIHLKGIMLPGSDVGLSPVEAARQSIGLGLAATQYGAQFFDGEGNMPGVIEIPKVANPGSMREMAEAWRRRRSRKQGRGLPGVLDDGATWKVTGVTNEQAQFLATRQFTAAEIAGQMFLLDPSDLGIGVQGQSLTYANLEQRNLRRVQVALLPWIVRIEAALSALMAAPRFVKLNVDGLLRADLLTRYQSYRIGLGDGVPFLTQNEPRSLEDLPPFPDGDAPPVPAVAPAPPQGVAA